MSWTIGMPNLGHTMETGTVIEWKKRVGDLVAAGDVVAIVETDKASFDVESPFDGMVIALKAELGVAVPVGAPIALVGRPGKARRRSEPTEPAAPAGQGAAVETAAAALATMVQVSAAVPAPAAVATPAAVLATLTEEIAAPAEALPAAQRLGFWRDMVRIRLFERAAIYQSTLGRIWGALHSYEGQESCAVGVCSALERGDYAASTHRGHGHCLAMGARMDRMMAELFGRETGYCRGKGGSLHIADASVGMLGANGIVGAGYAIAAGAALSAKANRTGRVAVVFFGDGAVTRGTFHEVMNMASLWKLPLLLVCENNGLAQYVHTAETMVFDSVASLAAGYRMPGVTIDGNDVSAVYRATGRAAARARGGEGPTLLELKTQRFMGHSSGDPQVYRTKEQVQALRQSRDPIARLEAELKAEGLLGDRAARFAEIEAEVAAAVRFAESSPYPPAGALFEDVYA